MKEKYQGPYQTEWEFMKDVLLKEGVPEEVILREDGGYVYLSECDQLQKSDRCSGHSGEKGNYLLQSPACQKMQAVLSVLIPTDNLSHLPFGCGNQPGKLV